MNNNIAIQMHINLLKLSATDAVDCNISPDKPIRMLEAKFLSLIGLVCSPPLVGWFWLNRFILLTLKLVRFSKNMTNIFAWAEEDRDKWEKDFPACSPSDVFYVDHRSRPQLMEVRGHSANKANVHKCAAISVGLSTPNWRCFQIMALGRNLEYRS